LRTFRFVAIRLLAVAASIFGWRTTRAGLHSEIATPSAQPFVTQIAIQPLQI